MTFLKTTQVETIFEIAFSRVVSKEGKTLKRQFLNADNTELKEIGF